MNSLKRYRCHRCRWEFSHDDAIHDQQLTCTVIRCPECLCATHDEFTACEQCKERPAEQGYDDCAACRLKADLRQPANDEFARSVVAAIEYARQL